MQHGKRDNKSLITIYTLLHLLIFSILWLEIISLKVLLCFHKVHLAVVNIKLRFQCAEWKAIDYVNIGSKKFKCNSAMIQLVKRPALSQTENLRKKHTRARQKERERERENWKDMEREKEFELCTT